MDGGNDKPSYEQLEARIIVLETEKLHLSAQVLELEVQLMDAAMMNIAEKRPQAMRALAQIQAELKK